MKWFGVIQAGIALACLNFAHGASRSPNVVFILSDDQGFDFFYGFYLGEVHSYFKHDYFGAHALHSQRKPVHTTGYMTDLFTEEAVKVIENKSDDQPLFLYLSYNAPHDPLEAKPEDEAKYPKVIYQHRKTYLAMIDCMDQGIGRVLQALEDKGIRDNTLIVFTSDNGGVFAREQFAHNTPLRHGRESVSPGERGSRRFEEGGVEECPAGRDRVPRIEETKQGGNDDA